MEVAKEVFEIKRRSTPHNVVRRSFPLYAPVYIYTQTRVQTESEIKDVSSKIT